MVGITCKEKILIYDNLSVLVNISLILSYIGNSFACIGFSQTAAATLPMSDNIFTHMKNYFLKGKAPTPRSNPLSSSLPDIRAVKDASSQAPDLRD